MKIKYKGAAAAMLLTLAALSLTACQSSASQSSSSQSSSQSQAQQEYEWQKYMSKFAYTETNAAGETFKISAYYGSGYCVMTIYHEDGSQQIFYTDPAVLYELKDYNDEENFTNWIYEGPDTPEKDEAPQIRVTCELANKSYHFGTNHMPDENGREKLARIKEMLLSYATEETELQPFTVTIGDKEYSTVPGTGNLGGTGAIIDFGEDKWWEIQHFVGHYELTDAAKEAMGDEIRGSSSGYADIDEDGNIHVVTAEEDVSGQLDEERGYGVWASALGNQLFLDFEDEACRFIHINMAAEPYPGDFEGIEIILERVEQ